MTRKNKIVISITGIVLVLLILIGLTYGYYLTRISGNTSDKSISIDLANLELTYSDGNGLIEAKNIKPGETIATKTFTVKNTGNTKINNYVVYLDSVINNFEDKNDLKLTLTCTSDIRNCNGTNITYPSTNTMLVTNDIEEKETQSYELKVEFIETNDDQSDNMNKEMSGNILIKDIKGLNSTLETVTGTNDLVVENGKLLTNYRIYGNSIQDGTPSIDTPVEIESVGDAPYNLFDADSIMEEQGWTKQTNGSYYISTNNLIYQKKVWENTENYTGQIRVDYKVKYSISSQHALQGAFLNFYYKDGTNSSITLSGYSTSYQPAVSGNISTKDKIVDYISWTFGSGSNSTWIKDLMISKDLSNKDYEPYRTSKYKIPITVNTKNLISTDSLDLNGNNLNDLIFDKNLTLPAVLSWDLDFTPKGSSALFSAVIDGETKYVTSNQKKWTLTGNQLTSIRVLNWNKDTGKVSNIQLEKGKTKTEYTPYKEPITTYIYLDEPLRKFENNADYIDFKSGAVIRKTQEKKYTENDDWAVELTNNFYSNSNLCTDKLGTNTKVLCNYQTSTAASVGNENVFISSTGKLNIQTNKITHTTDDFKKWISGKELKIIYPIETEKKESIDLSSIKLFEGTNTISIGTKTYPSNTELEYIK